VLRLKAQEHRLLVAQSALIERQIANMLKHTVTSLPVLGGLGTLGAAELLVDVGGPRRFPSADAFASYAGTAPIRASSVDAGIIKFSSPDAPGRKYMIVTDFGKRRSGSAPATRSPARVGAQRTAVRSPETSARRCARPRSKNC
jgi:hypothetical protein